MSEVDLTGVTTDLRVSRNADTIFRGFFTENGIAVDLTGDTITLVAKDRRGGTVKLNESFTLEDQTGSLKGQATVTIPRTKVIGTGDPNDDPSAEIEWVYQVVRIHSGKRLIPFEGTITIAPGL